MNFNSDQNFEVIVSHPAKQGQIYQIPLTIQRKGIPVKFLTGLYYKPEQFPYSIVKFLPPSKQAEAVRQLEKRRLQELNPESVISLGGPWLEMIYRPWGLYWPWWKTHDWLVSRWIARLPLSASQIVLHTFDGYVKRTFSVAEQRGFIRILEITLPIVADELIQEEMRKLGMINQHNQMSDTVKEETIEGYRTADYLVAQSNLTVNYLLQLGIPRERIVLMPLGVDTDRFQPATIHTDNLPFRAIFVGQLSVRKGLHHLLEAWKQLDLPEAELILAGSKVNDPFVIDLLERYTGVYRWLGFVDVKRLPDIYKSSDIFVLPSLAEGSSMVLHEAMASGLPCVITSNVGCILRDGIEGFSIPVGDINALKDRIFNLYQNKKLRSAMGYAARDRAQKFNWKEYGRRLALMYHIIVSGERKSASDILDMTQW